ncbi:MAG: GumC family protein, partial [Hyphomicrobiales bacterium]
VTTFMQPQYVSSVLLEISRKPEQAVKVDDLDQPSSFDDREFYQTQYSLLEARSLAESVVNRFRLYDDRAFFTEFGVDPTDKEFLKDAANGTPEQQRKKRFDGAVEILSKHIIVEPIRNSRLVSVSFVSPDAALSQRIANAWADAFIQSQLAKRNKAASYARTFLEGRLVELRRRLEASEKTAVDFAIANRIITISSSETGEGGTSRMDRSPEDDSILALNEALAQAKVERVRAESKLQHGSARQGHDSSNQLLASLRQKRAELAAEVAKLSVQYTPKYGAVRAAQGQLTAIDNGIRQELARLDFQISDGVREARVREARLSEQLERAKRVRLEAKAKENQYAIYQRDADTNRQLYESLLQRYKEIGAASGAGISSVVVIDSAKLQVEPSSPRLGFNLLVAFALGLVVAALAVFILEHLDEQVKEPSEVERLLEQPLLGVVPLTDGTPFDDLQLPRSELTESYVSLQALLQVSTQHGIPRSIAVTSSRQGEGKSTSCFAISEVLARSGRKVVLVDADMRKPSQHQLLGVNNQQGTSSFLSGDDNLAHLIKSSHREGLSIITSGPTPPNAAELLIGSRLSELVERLLETFDHVVIDSPPVLGLADAPLIGNVVEAVIFVVESSGPRSNLVRVALHRVFIGGGNVLGVLLTKFNVKKGGWGSAYGYGYGYDAKDTAL